MSAYSPRIIYSMGDRYPFLGLISRFVIGMYQEEASKSLSRAHNMAEQYVVDLGASELKMNGLGKGFVPLQPLDIAQVGHPSVDVFQIEHLEDGVVLHVPVQSVYYGTLGHDGIADFLPLLEHGFSREANPWCLHLVRLQFAPAQFQMWVGLQFCINLFLAVGAEPQLAVLQHHVLHGSYLRFAVQAYRGHELYADAVQITGYVA